MLDAVFSFRGRIGRGRYFLSIMGLGFATVALVVAFAIVSVVLHIASGPAGGKAMVGLGLLCAIPLFLWIAMALQAKRLRDIGWDPVIVIPASIVVLTIDRLVAGGVPSLAVGPLHHQTWVGVLVNLALGGSLLFWPGRGEGGSPPLSGGDWTANAAPAPAAQVPLPVARPTAAWPAPAGGSFGRRGL